MKKKVFIDRNVCYLCGKLGADSNDHVPPKALFNTTEERLTLPAHITCNNAFSKDEEYFRDVMTPQNAAFGIKGFENKLEKVFRSWASTGKARYKSFITTANPLKIKTKSGDTHNLISIQADTSILKKVAIKIARGVIYNDTGIVSANEDYISAYIPNVDVRNVKEKEKDELFWKILSSQSCLHTKYGPFFGARRAYILSEKINNKDMITCFMGLMLGSAFYIIIVVLPLDDLKDESLEIFALGIR